LLFLAKILRNVDEGYCVDVVFLDLAKALDKVPRLRLLEKLKKHGIRGKLLRTIDDWLSNREQRVCIFNGRVWVKYGVGSHRAQYWGPCYS